jgi:hypothetical protein
MSQGNISSNGDYVLACVRISDIIGFPNTDPEIDFLPTGFPSALNPEEFTHLDVTSNLTGIDIYVRRGPGENAPSLNMTKVSGTVLSNNKPIKDAVVYAMVGNNAIGYGVTNSKGEYTINLPEGDHILVAHRIGQNSDSKQVTLTGEGLDNITFNLNPKAESMITLTSPVEFKLSQNYPNPFNPATIISYSIPKNGNVSLRVFNTVGQQVAELINATQNAGTYDVQFNAVGLSSGIYYYRLEANGFVDTKKMILVK